MNAADVSNLARQLFESRGVKAIADAAQKAAAFEAAGDAQQAKDWRRVEAALLELRGPRES